MKKDKFNIKYEKKIVTSAQFNKIKNKNKNKNVALCHGVFDLVHPGHLRHFGYAKSKADILVVSITDDKFVNKDNYRPYVPAYLRAINVAAYEIIDYVIIDNNKEPLDLINKIKPDFFVKGYDYSNRDNPKTLKELQIIKKYGGEMIFSPGDVVFSSSKFINQKKPDLSIDKLKLILEIEKININKLKRTLDDFKNIKVHIIGDTIVDIYQDTVLIGGQTKTPTLSLAIADQTTYLGGAGVVAKHLKEAGAKVVFTTIVGKDKYAKFVKNELKKNKITSNLIEDKTRPTTIKKVILNKSHRLLKLDTVDNSPINDEILIKISNIIKKTKTDIVIFSDFRHGIFSRKTIPNLKKSIPKKTFTVADTQVASRWGNILEFKNFDLITPNEKEARFSLFDQDSHVKNLATDIFKVSKCKNLILKLGERGIISSKAKNLSKKENFYVLDSFTKDPADPVGAGDALLAYSALALYSSKSLAVSSIIGSISAALECEINGNLPIKNEEIFSKLLNLMRI